MLNLAISYMKGKDTEKAEEAYREVISKWPSSEEATLANEDLRRYYSSHGGLQEYASFLNGIDGAPQIDASEMETLAFEGAETVFAEDVKKTDLLEKYVADYPSGRYLAQALLDIATGRDEAGDTQGALNIIDSLLEQRGDALKCLKPLCSRQRFWRAWALTTGRRLPKPIVCLRKEEARIMLPMPMPESCGTPTRTANA